MLLGMMRLAGNKMTFFKSADNQLEISYYVTMGHKSMMRLAGNQMQFWKLIGISWKSDENQLEIS